METETQPFDPEALWSSGYMNVTYEFAAQCAKFRDTNPCERPALEEIMAFLMTELWDRSFSQSEIRSAFQRALEEMPGYAAGEERRGDRDRR